MGHLTGNPLSPLSIALQTHKSTGIASRIHSFEQSTDSALLYDLLTTCAQQRIARCFTDAFPVRNNSSIQKEKYGKPVSFPLSTFFF